jgi:uncharacterized MnhB-related membrane protein
LPNNILSQFVWIPLASVFENLLRALAYVIQNCEGGVFMFNGLLQIAMIILTVFLALLTVELRDLLHAVICLCGMCISIGALFWLLNAPYVSVFQLLVYASAVIVLFVAAVMLTKREEET